jgi:hypothetical protein
MAVFKLSWDQTGERLYETGVDRGVVYPQVSGAYPKGAAWNGLSNVTLSPSGAEATPLYANNHKYLNLISLEELAGSIEAYTYPDEFAECNGYKELTPGVRVGQQKRKAFGFCYRTLIGNDTEGTAYGYKITLVYGALAAPSEDANATINDSPEAKTMSWEFSTTPVEVEGFEPTASLEIICTEENKAKVEALEAILYGTGDTEARLPLPDEVKEIMAA